MKKGKLLLLLTVALSLALLFCSCNQNSNADQDTAAEFTPVAEPEAVEHEIRNYFVINREIEPVSFADITKLDGEIVELDRENNLISLVTKDLDNFNNVIKTIKVYDVTTSECILEDSVTYPLYSSGTKYAVDFTVKIDYPIIRVAKTSYSEDSNEQLEPQYDVSYYFATKDSQIIKTTDKNDYSKTEFYNGLVCFEMGDELVWVNKNMEVVRTANAVADSGLALDRYSFDAEYQDYLYSWDGEKVQVYNRAGVCSALYTIEHDGELNVHVLDNGNVLIQDIEYVDDYTACDFKMKNYYDYSIERCVMKSYVMSCTDGVITEVELDFIVDYLETAYEAECDNREFPFALAEGGENQALIYRIANGSISLYQEYVSLGNDLEIKYSVKNSKPGAYLSSAEVINANFYKMAVAEGGSYQNYIFDLDGNVVTACNDSTYVTKTYIVTENAIYDHSMNVVYDIAGSEFASCLLYVDVTSNTVYFSKPNFTTGAEEEIYVFDHTTGSPKLFADGVENIAYVYGCEGYYWLINTENDDRSLVTMDGTVILKAFNILDTGTCEDALIVQTEFEGKALVYVIK